MKCSKCGKFMSKEEQNKRPLTFSDMFSLDWSQILHKAIQQRPSAWYNDNPVAEYRNASDCIAIQVINAMKEKGFILEE